MTFKEFSNSWWLWGLCVAAALYRGWLRHWDWMTWFLLGFFASTAAMRILARRRQKVEVARDERTTQNAV
jgi:hypothetical protein